MVLSIRKVPVSCPAVMMLMGTLTMSSMREVHTLVLERLKDPREKIVARLALTLFERRSEVVLERDEAFGRLDELIRLGGVGEQGEPVVAPALELLHVVDRDAQHVYDDERRESIRELRVELTGAIRRELVHEGFGNLPDAPFERRCLPIRERGLNRSPERRVVGRVVVRKEVVPGVALVELGLHLGGQGFAGKKTVCVENASWSRSARTQSSCRVTNQTSYFGL